MVFIIPGTNEKYTQGLLKPLVHHTFAFGVAALASVLERDGIKVKIHNDSIRPLDIEGIKKLACQEDGRQIFALSCLTAQAFRAVELLRLIKEAVPDSVVIVGGIHATNMPQEFMDAGFDYAFIGEAELFITELVSSLSEGKDISNIKGVVSRNTQGKMRICPPSNELIDLGELPLFPFHLFHEDMDHYEVGILMSARGCPNQCIFCSMRTTTGLSYRVRPMNMVLEELEIIINKYSAKSIFFIEDNFVVRKQRTIELCDQIINRGWNKKAKFICQFRGDATTPEVLEKLVEAGFETVTLGIETGSERVAKIIKKGETVEENCNAVYLSKKYGLSVSATFIIGFPHETAKDRRATFKLAMKLPLDAVRINIAIPFPGTPMYEMTKHKLQIEEGWSNFNVVSSLVTGPFGALKLPYVPEGATEAELRFLSMWGNMKFWLKPVNFIKFFTLSTTGVTRFPPGWYVKPIFLLDILKIGVLVASIILWIAFLGIKYNVERLLVVSNES